MCAKRALVSLLLPAVASAVLGAAPAAADELSPPTTAAPTTEASGGDVGIESIGDCIGCYAGWGLWDLGSSIRGLRASYMGEVVDLIHVHWAKPATDSCSGEWRDGDYAAQGSKEAYYSNVDQVFDQQFSQGSQHAWGNAGAHRWMDDDIGWQIGGNGETDICTAF